MILVFGQAFVIGYALLVGSLFEASFPWRMYFLYVLVPCLGAVPLLLNLSGLIHLWNLLAPENSEEIASAKSIFYYLFFLTEFLLLLWAISSATS